MYAIHLACNYIPMGALNHTKTTENTSSRHPIVPKFIFPVCWLLPTVPTFGYIEPTTNTEMNPEKTGKQAIYIYTVIRDYSNILKSDENIRRTLSYRQNLTILVTDTYNLVYKTSSLTIDQYSKQNMCDPLGLQGYSNGGQQSHIHWNYNIMKYAAT